MHENIHHFCCLTKILIFLSGQILSTTAPISHPTSVVPRKLPSQTLTPTTATNGTKRFFEKITKVFNKTLFFPTKGYFPNREFGHQNWTEIIVGIIISAVALFFLVAAICLGVYWKKCCTAGSNSDQRRQSIFCAHVSPHSRSNG